MSDIYGMAVEITQFNYGQLSIVNGGVAVYFQDDPVCYFVFPYDPTDHCVILSKKAFDKTYEFIEPDEVDSRWMSEIRKKRELLGILGLGGAS